MIKVETPEGTDEYHGAQVMVTNHGDLIIASAAGTTAYDTGDWLNIEYQVDKP